MIKSYTSKRNKTCTIALGQRVKTASMNSSTIERYSSPSNLGCLSPKSVKLKSCEMMSTWYLLERIGSQAFYIVWRWEEPQE